MHLFLTVVVGMLPFGAHRYIICTSRQEAVHPHILNHEFVELLSSYVSSIAFITLVMSNPRSSFPII